MKRFSVLLAVLALLAVVAVTAFAQDGEGGEVIYSDSSDPSAIIPMLSSDVTSSNYWSRFYPALWATNPFTGDLEAGRPGTIATGWEYSEDGLTLTVTLREDAFWSDGTQITAADYMWAADSMKSGLLDSSRPTQMFETLDDGTEGSGSVVDVVAVDDFTLEFTFASATCTAINDILTYVVPAHVYEADFGDDLAAMNEEPMYDPGVYFGAFIDPELIPGDRWSLVANSEYPDAVSDSGVLPSSITVLNLPDADVEIERFIAGDTTLTGIPGTRQAEFEADERFQTYRFNRQGYVFFAFNHSDPANPQPAYDEDGNFIEQDPHPVLGDPLVRQAIVTSVNMDAIIENNLGGNAVRVGIPSIPAAFDWNPDLLYPFDPAAAMELLDEAGWMDEDGDGVRECVSCAQSLIDAEYVGTPMVVTLNASDGGSEDSVNMIEFIAQSMRDVGIDAQTNYIDWGSAFLPELDGQLFDMAILAWSLGLPIDPDNRAIFGSSEDIPGSGFNFGSYVNQEVDALYEAAIDPAQTDGCTTEGRAAIYNQINEILFEELPYMFMYSNLSMTAAQASLEGWDPAPFSRTWNEDSFDTVSGE